MKARYAPLMQLTAALGLLALIGYLALSPPVETETDHDPQQAADEAADLEESMLRIDLQNPRISEYKDGRTVWTISAQAVARDSGDKVIRFLDIAGGFFDENHEPTMNFYAKLVELDLENRSFVISGGIGIENREMGTYLSADTARWEPDRQMLIGQGSPIVMTKDDLTATGTILEVDARMQTLTLSGGVRLDLRFEPRSAAEAAPGAGG